jgi:hypothetical protein
MAIWQWKIYLIPKQAILKHFSVTPSYIEEEWFYSINWGEGNFSDELQQYFDSVMERTYDSSASENVLSWEKYDENEVILVMEDKQVSMVGIQIDTTKIDIDFVESLVMFGKENDFLFWELESTKLIEPEITTFLNELKNSRAMSFTSKPNRFFEDKQYLERVNKENRRKVN